MDTLELYRWAVQDPETQVTVLQIMFDCLHPGRSATILREDFAGSSAESVAWVALKESRRALAIDLDGPTLAWAQRRAERILGPRVENIQFIESDVLTAHPPEIPPADIISVLNFSIFYFRERAALRNYFQHARRCLISDGLLVLNAFGGSSAMQIHTDQYSVIPKPRLATEAAIPPFEYQWEQCAYDAMTGRLDCRIHFVVPNPDDPVHPHVLQDAFRYNWRLWTLPELIELLHEAGFTNVQVWRHTYDPAQGASGVFLGQVNTIENLDTWIAYLVATR